MKINRCSWVNLNNLDYINYHDKEWGIPCYNEILLFEALNLECMQAGLKWEIILNKRIAYRDAFDQWDPKKIAGYTDTNLSSLLSNSNIIRNRLKIIAAITNAKSYLRLCNDVGGLRPFLWNFIKNIPIYNAWKNQSEYPSKTVVSEQLSKTLSKYGFKFVGPTIIYSYMQAIGMVNDHLISCYLYSHKH